LQRESAAAVLCIIMIFSWNELILTLYPTQVSEMQQTVPIRMQSHDTSAEPTKWDLLLAAGTAALIYLCSAT